LRPYSPQNPKTRGFPEKNKCEPGKINKKYDLSSVLKARSDFLLFFPQVLFLSPSSPSPLSSVRKTTEKTSKASKKLPRKKEMRTAH